jgi:hypothetical protein
MEYTSLYESSVVKKKKYTHGLKLKKGGKKLLYLPKIIVTVIAFEDTMSGPDV